mgnify:CR=1 FL=1
MKRALVVVVLVGVAVGLGWWALRPEGPAPTPGSEPSATAGPPSGSTSGPRRSVLEGVSVPARPGDAPTRPEEARSAKPRRPGRFALRVGEVPALAGLEVETVGAGDREALKVPDDYGRGVVVTRIHPDAPAAEAGLLEGDVIVRAMRENVDAPTDLERVVGQRDHTLLMASRDGELMQLVIQPPFDPSRGEGSGEGTNGR